MVMEILWSLVYNFFPFEIPFLQALWRGYSWRKSNDTAKIKALRRSLEKANEKSREENKLYNRTAIAIEYLLKYKHLSYILAALKHLGQYFILL